MCRTFQLAGGFIANFRKISAPASSSEREGTGARGVGLGSRGRARLVDRLFTPLRAERVLLDAWFSAPVARRAARSFGAGCHHSRRAAHRAATLKVRAALTEKGPPLGPPFEKGAARRAARRAARPARAALRSGRPSGQVAARRAAQARPKGGQSRAREREGGAHRQGGPPSRPDHSVKCAGSSKTGSGDLFLPILFGVCVKDALFRPPRGPPPPPQAHQRPRPVKATTYRTPVPKPER